MPHSSNLYQSILIKMDTRKKLLLVFCIPLLVSLGIVFLYESEVLLPGQWTNDAKLEYVIATVMELMAICAIPIALRLFQFKRIQEKLSADPEHGLFAWGVLRIEILTIPLMLNTWFYYMFMNVAFGYMAIILLLSLMFVYPSKSRCEHDVR